jgi:hypothetical protein
MRQIPFCQLAAQRGNVAAFTGPRRPRRRRPGKHHEFRVTYRLGQTCSAIASSSHANIAQQSAHVANPHVLCRLLAARQLQNGHSWHHERSKRCWTCRLRPCLRGRAAGPAFGTFAVATPLPAILVSCGVLVFCLAAAALLISLVPLAWALTRAARRAELLLEVCFLAHDFHCHMAAR